jgi:hypothetical protein
MPTSPSLRKYNSRKLEFRSKVCVFLGYSPMHKGYNCLDRSSGCIYITRDVIFDENVFPFATPGVIVDVSQLHPVSFPPTEPVVQNNDVRNYDISMLPVDPLGTFPCAPMQVPGVVLSPTASPADGVPARGAIDVHVHASSLEPGSPGSASSGPDEEASSPAVEHPVVTPTSGGGSSDVGPSSLPPWSTDGSSSPPNPPARAPSPPPAAAPRMIVTRGQNNVHRPKVYRDGTVRYDPYQRHALLVVPASHRTALVEPA